MVWNIERGASVIEACAIEDGVAADNDVRKEVATDTTSGGVGTLPTPVLETPAVGHEGPRETGETNGGDGKACNRNDEDEDRSGQRQDPSTPGPETTAVVPECQHKTGEMRGGREEVWPGESTYEEDAGPGMGVYEGSDGKARSGKEERVADRPDRKTKRKKSEAGAGQPGPNRRKPTRPGLFD